MASFPRAILPSSTTAFLMPGAMQTWSSSGKGQHRSTIQVGRIWRETIGLFKADSINGRALLAFLNNCWRNGLVFDIEHYFYQTHKGGGTGVAVVNGPGQTGTTLNVNGWGGTNPVLRAGDLIRIAGLTPVYDVTADAPNLVSTLAALSINPPIFAGGSPVDNAIVTYTGVRLNAFLYEAPSIPDAVKFGYIDGLQLTFREAV